MKTKINDLSTDQLYRLIELYSFKKVDQFVGDRDDIDEKLKILLYLIAPHLLYPYEIRKVYNKSLKTKRINDHDQLIKSYQTLNNNPLTRDMLNKDNKEIIKKLFVIDFYNKSLKHKRVNDLTEIKEYLKPVVTSLKKKRYNKTEIANFIYDLFHHFNFDDTRNLDPGLYKKNLWMMVHRL